MPNFSYTAITQEGKNKKGTLEAAPNAIDKSALENASLDPSPLV